MRPLTYAEIVRDLAKEARLEQITALLTAPCELPLYEQALLIQERHDILEELKKRHERSKSAPCPYCGRV